MRWQYLATIIAVSCIIGGCDRSESAKTKAAHNGSQSRDPVATFKAIVEKVAALHTSYLIEDKEPVETEKPTPVARLTGDPDFDAKMREWNAERLKSWQESQDKFAQGLRWRRFWDSTEDQTFDIRKTDSLVSPVTGYIEFKLHTVQSTRLTQSNAEVAPEDQYLYQKYPYQKAPLFRADFAFQDNIWVVKSISKKDEADEIDPDPQWKPVAFATMTDALQRALTDVP